MNSNSLSELNKNLTESFTTALIDSGYSSDEQYRPRLLVNNPKDGVKVLYALQDELKNCKEFAISVAFINCSGLISLKDILKELEIKGIKGRILTTDYLKFTEPQALKELKQFKNIEIKMYKVKNHGEGFHTKGYIFKKENIYDIIVGSSNLTQTALSTNKEWNIKLVAKKEGEYASKVVKEFDELWFSQYALAYDDFIDEYEIEYRVAKKQREVARESQVISFEQSQLKPNKMQIEFIERLQKLIDNGEKKALLISATGTGKTYASAFAMRELRVKKLLFVVHREQIAVQAKRTFEMVFGKKIRFGLLTGNVKKYDTDFIFATKDTFTQENVYTKFDKCHFDAIIIDEVHRLGETTTYKRLLEYFKPKKLWLGMTASPERTDGYDIYNEFDHNIACEIRLQQALEDDLLCPFHYFGITEFNSTGEDSDNDRIEHELSDFRYLTSKKRIDYIISKMEFYGHSGDRVKGLVFCSRVEEAKELSKKFNERGYNTAVLVGDNNDEKIREDYIERLASDNISNKLDYIFTVNVFNEGVDIPEINQIIMLRPTESPIIFVQQLGRGLRKAKDKDYVVVLDFIGNYNNNFMIPIALSGDRSYNKDNIRKFMQHDLRCIPGCTTISFDKISKEKIYKSIDISNFSDLKDIKRDYNNFKNKLGRIPKINEFDEYDEMDPLRIIDNKGSYYRFLVDVEKDNYSVRLNANEEKYIEFLSEKLANGKRIQELALIKEIIENKECNIDDFNKLIYKSYSFKLTDKDIISVGNVLNDKFLTGSNKMKYAGCKFVEIQDDCFTISEVFKKMLKNTEFKDMIEELLIFGTNRYKKKYYNRYKDTNFVLYEKYSYEEVCRLLNWETNVVAQNIGGYKYDEYTNTYPVFINYDKDENISDTINYNDRFLSESKLIAISKSNRSLTSKDVSSLINSNYSNTKVYLFIRKNKDAKNSAKEFYFLGEVYYSGQSKEIKMKNTGLSAVEIHWDLETPVKQNIYEYIVY